MSPQGRGAGSNVLDSAGRPIIREGDRSEEVTDIQSRLRALGFEVEDDPGIFGAATRNAVKTFQQSRNILIDGIVGPHTWSELVAASWRVGDRVLYLKQPPMRGDDIAALQSQLNALGFDCGREDGIFGRDTDRAVRAFQKEYAVEEDGIFGSRSFASLTGLRVDRPGIAAGLREELRSKRSAGIEDALIVVDPGHGGTDPGALGTAGIHEAEICWDIAERLTQRLVAAGARVRLTRTETESPDHTERARRANEISGDLYISLHLNAHEKQAAQGASTYYFATSMAGEALAEHMQRALVALGLEDCRSHARSYTVLKETRMPAVLVEPAFITNPDDRQRLEEPGFRTAIAEAIARGVQEYLDTR